MKSNLTTKKNRYWFFIIVFFLFVSNDLSAQNKEWEIDRFIEEKQSEERALDSILVHMNKKWEIRLTYGNWFYTKSARSEEEELFILDGPMNSWQLSGAWHFSERLWANVSVGLQLKKESPGTPDISSVLNGDDIELEGYGVILLPVETGLNYYLTKNRFRPYIGIGVGAVNISARSILAEGNLDNGITRTDTEFNDRIGFGKIKAGFDYRLSEWVNFRLDTSFTNSNQLEEAVGGFLSYTGWGVSAGFSFIF
jgi:hypothetical protein